MIARLSMPQLLKTAVVAMFFWTCVFADGQQYTPPAAPVPPAYKESFPQVQGSPVWTVAMPQDHIDRERWWRVFGDSDLDALEEQIAISNQTLLAAEAQFRQARAAVHANRSNFYPTVSAGVSATNSRVSTNGATGALSNGTVNDFSVPLSVAWEPDIWGRVRTSTRAAASSAQASAAQLAAVKLTLQSELAYYYLQLRGLDGQKQILDQTVVNYQQSLQLTEDRFGGGVASQEDVAQAQTQLEDTKAQAIDIGIARSQYEHAIAVLTGKPASQFSLPPKQPKTTLPAVPSSLPSELLQRRPDIAAAERQVAAANAQAGVARKAFFPSLLLGGSAGFQSINASDWFTWPSRFWSIGPSAVMTIFDKGRRKAGVQEAQAVYDQTVANYRQTTLTAFQEVEDSLAALRILREEQESRNKAVLSAQQAHEISMVRYQAGVVSYLDVVSTQAALLSNRRASLDIVTRQQLASVQLIKSLGGGWSDSQLPAQRRL